MIKRAFLKNGVLAALLGGLVAGALVLYGAARAPADAELFEAVRVALAPGAEYATLHVEGMT